MTCVKMYVYFKKSFWRLVLLASTYIVLQYMWYWISAMEANEWLARLNGNNWQKEQEKNQPGLEVFFDIIASLSRAPSSAAGSRQTSRCVHSRAVIISPAATVVRQAIALTLHILILKNNKPASKSHLLITWQIMAERIITSSSVQYFNYTSLAVRKLPEDTHERQKWSLRQDGTHRRGVLE